MHPSSGWLNLILVNAEVVGKGCVGYLVPIKHPRQPDSVTLKMEAVLSSQTLEHSFSTRHRNPMEDRQLINALSADNIPPV
jgi:hypothetical protein